MVSKILYTYKINSFMYDRMQSLAKLSICAREILLHTQGHQTNC